MRDVHDPSEILGTSSLNLSLEEDQRRHYIRLPRIDNEGDPTCRYHCKVVLRCVCVLARGFGGKETTEEEGSEFCNLSRDGRHLSALVVSNRDMESDGLFDDGSRLENCKERVSGELQAREAGMVLTVRC